MTVLLYNGARRTRSPVAVHTHSACMTRGVPTATPVASRPVNDTPTMLNMFGDVVLLDRGASVPIEDDRVADAGSVLNAFETGTTALDLLT